MKRTIEGDGPGRGVPEKVLFYFMSLSGLFFFVFILTVDIPLCFDSDAHFIGCRALLLRNKLSIFSLVMVAIGISCFFHFKGLFKNSSSGKYEILETESRDFDFIAFFTTYLIPLICIDFTNSRYVVVFFILIAVIGYIFTKTELYVSNPILILMGYRLYSIEVKSKILENRKILVITKDLLKKGDNIEKSNLDEFVWICKRVGKIQNGQ